eukprot:GEMP01116216.1.p1 GENE.GEMP01116216.1~~GEMP01116216.1.p1  ORF type:complete len:154 (+),score=17.43 GEMP01116216.1:168-629(+)
MITEFGVRNYYSAWDDNEKMPPMWGGGTVWVIAVSDAYTNIWHSIHWWASAVANKPPKVDTLAVVFTRGIDAAFDRQSPRISKHRIEVWKAFHKPILDLVAPRVIFPNFLSNWTLNMCFRRGYIGGTSPLHYSDNHHWTTDRCIYMASRDRKN